MTKSITLNYTIAASVAVAMVFAAATPAFAAVNSTRITINVTNRGTIDNVTQADSHTGNNTALGSVGGSGGTGGSVTNSGGGNENNGGASAGNGGVGGVVDSGAGDENNGGASAGTGGAGGAGGLGGTIVTGNASSQSAAVNLLNTTFLRVRI